MLPLTAAAITMGTIHAISLSKFILISFENDGSGFKSFKDVYDGVAVPGFCTSRCDLFRIESVGDGVRIDAVFPPTMDELKTFELFRIGHDLTLEVAESVWRANIAFSWSSPMRCHGSGDVRPRCDSFTFKNSLN